MALGSAASGLLMVGMGLLSVVLAFTGPGMSSGGWQTELSAWLQHLSASALAALAWIPGWILAAVLVVGFGLLLRRVLRSQTTPVASVPPGGGDDVAEPTPTSVTVEENRRAQQQR
jgi:TRAP-type C4-dicarboxylate transport system permease small subunit